MISHHPSTFLLWYRCQGLFLELPACSCFCSPAGGGFPSAFLTSRHLGSLISPPLSVCRSSLKISLVFFLQMVSQPQNLAMEFVTVSSPTLVPESMPNLGGWIRRSYLLPRKNSLPWRKLVLSNPQPPCGPLLSTWSRRRTEVGGPAEITGG